MSRRPACTWRVLTSRTSGVLARSVARPKTGRETDRRGLHIHRGIVAACCARVSHSQCPNCARRGCTYNVDGSSDSMIDTVQIRNCFREPIPEIDDAARYLDADSNSPYVRRGPSHTLKTADDPRVAERMPTAEQRRQLHLRDGYHCRFCGIPVIRKEVRARIRAVYPDALRWGMRNLDQHTAFQVMWAQYDHLVPHALGGTNDLENIVIACAPCNFGRMNSSLEEVGIADPRTRSPVPGSWDGLTRFH